MKVKLIASLMIIVLLLSVFAGCSGNQQEQASTQQSKEPSEAATSAETEEQTPVVIYTADAGTPQFDLVIADIKAKTGVDVVGLEAPSNYPDLVPKITAMLSSGSDEVDIVFVDELLGVSFQSAGYFEPIDDVMTAEVKKQYPTEYLERICSYEGSTYMIPTSSEPMYLFVNKKMFADAGIAYPTTEAEFIDAAQKLTNGDVYGYGASWSLGGMLYNDVVRWMAAYDGDYLDWTKDGSKKALQMMYDFVNKYKITPAAVIGDTYDALNQKFIDGKYAMIYQWSYIYGVIGADKFAAEFDVIPNPTFTTNKTISAGWAYAVNAASKNKEAAKKVMAYFASVDGQRQLINLSAASCANTAVLNDPEIKAQYPMLGKLGEYAVAGSLTPRPINSKINAIMDATEQIVQNYLAGNITLDQCIEQGQADIDRIMSE